jgi:hypothetical protein
MVGMLGLGVVSSLDIPSLVANASMGGTITALGLKGAMGHDLHLVVLVVLQGDVWVFHLGVIGWIFLIPLLSKWHNTSLIHFTLTPSAESFAHSRSHFLFCRWEAWRAFG